MILILKTETGNSYSLTMMYRPLCFLLIILGTLGSIAVAGEGNNAGVFGEQANDLMKQLKDSGVIDAFEKELKDMLAEDPKDNEVKTDDRNKEKVSELEEFVQSYVKEKNIPLDSRIVKHLAELPVGEGGTPKHFVHLTQVLDKIHELALKDSPKLDAKVLDVIKRVKSLPIMLTSLNKLNGGGGDFQKPSKQAKTTAVASEEDDDGIASAIRDFLKTVKKNPEKILDIILPVLSEYQLMSDQSLQMAKIYGKTMVRSESFIGFMDNLAESLEAFASTPGGKHMVEILPQLIVADDREAVMDIIRKETENAWSAFFGKLDNSDVAEQFVDVVASGITATHAYLRGLLKDDMKMALANTFLISQGLPAIKPKKLTESLFALVDKCITKFSTWKVDMTTYKDDFLGHLASLEKDYIKYDAFNKLTEAEQNTFVSRFLRENLVEPLQYLWLAHKHITSHPDGHACAESILCSLNKHMSKEAKTSPMKQMLTKAFSLASSYGWTSDEAGAVGLHRGDQAKDDGGLNRWKLYQAIWQGCAPETDCSVLYTPPKGKNCRIFPWESNLMDLNFEHTEL